MINKSNSKTLTKKEILLMAANDENVGLDSLRLIIKVLYTPIKPTQSDFLRAKEMLSNIERGIK